MWSLYTPLPLSFPLPSFRVKCWESSDHFNAQKMCAKESKYNAHAICSLQKCAKANIMQFAQFSMHKYERKISLWNACVSKWNNSSEIMTGLAHLIFLGNVLSCLFQAIVEASRWPLSIREYSQMMTFLDDFLLFVHKASLLTFHYALFLGRNTV